MKKLLTLSALLCSLSCMAQHPGLVSLKGIGGNNEDAAAYVNPTADGGFILTIGTQSGADTGNIDTLFCNAEAKRTIFNKYNSDGSILEWSKCYEATGDTLFYYMFPQADGGFIFGGQYRFISSTTIGYDIGATNGFYVCKQDALGNILWSHIYGGEPSTDQFLADMIPTPDGGFLLVGDVYGTDTDFTVHPAPPGLTTDDICALKIDSLGNKQWSNAIGGSFDEDASMAVNGLASDYYVLGHTTSNDLDCTGNHDTSHATSDVYIVRLDSLGNIIWHKDMGGSKSDFGDCMLPDGKGGVMIGGDTYSLDGDVSHPIGQVGHYLQSIWLLDIDSAGNKLWDNCLGGGDDMPFSMCRGANSSIWIAAANEYRDSFEVDTFYGGTYDAWFVHTDSTGNFLGGKVIGSTGYDWANFIYPLSDGNFLGGGYYYDSTALFSSINYYGSGDAFLCVLSPGSTTAISMLNPQDAMALFPNPAHKSITLSLPAAGKFAIINNLGQYVYTAANTDNSCTVSVADLAAGLYIVRWQGTDGTVLTDKFIKE